MNLCTILVLYTISGQPQQELFELTLDTPVSKEDCIVVKEHMEDFMVTTKTEGTVGMLYGDHCMYTEDKTLI